MQGRGERPLWRTLILSPSAGFPVKFATRPRCTSARAARGAVQRPVTACRFPRAHAAGGPRRQALRTLGAECEQAPTVAAALLHDDQPRWLQLPADGAGGSVPGLARPSDSEIAPKTDPPPRAASLRDRAGAPAAPTSQRPRAPSVSRPKTRLLCPISPHDVHPPASLRRATVTAAYPGPRALWSASRRSRRSGVIAARARCSPRCEF